jgi:hypothetical protein
MQDGQGCGFRRGRRRADGEQRVGQVSRVRPRTMPLVQVDHRVVRGRPRSRCRRDPSREREDLRPPKDQRIPRSRRARRVQLLVLGSESFRTCLVEGRSMKNKATILVPALLLFGALPGLLLAITPASAGSTVASSSASGPKPPKPPTSASGSSSVPKPWGSASSTKR